MQDTVSNRVRVVRIKTADPNRIQPSCPRRTRLEERGKRRDGGRAPREAVPTLKWTKGSLGQLRVFQAEGQELRKGEPKRLCTDVEYYYYYTRRRARRRSLQMER